MNSIRITPDVHYVSDYASPTIYPMHSIRPIPRCALCIQLCFSCHLPYAFYQNYPIFIPFGYGIASPSDWCQALLRQCSGFSFKRSSLCTFPPLKMRPLRRLEMPGTNYPATPCHIREEWRRRNQQGFVGYAASTRDAQIHWKMFRVDYSNCITQVSE
jgi:hypothetical protein